MRNCAYETVFARRDVSVPFSPFAVRSVGGDESPESPRRRAESLLVERDEQVQSGNEFEYRGSVTLVEEEFVRPDDVVENVP